MKKNILKLLYDLSKSAKNDRSNSDYYYYWKDILMHFLLKNKIIAFNGCHYFTQSKSWMRYYTDSDCEYGYHDGIRWTECIGDDLGSIQGVIETKEVELNNLLFEKIKPLLVKFEKTYRKTTFTNNEWTYRWVY